MENIRNRDLATHFKCLNVQKFPLSYDYHPNNYNKLFT